MAVDIIARLMAMGNSGGTADVYTKDETDTLLAAKAATTYVDGIADMVIDKMQLWADYTQAYETQMTLKRSELNQVLNDQTKTQEEKDKVRQDFTKQLRYLELVRAKNAEIQTTGIVPTSIAIEAQNANSGLYTWSADGKIYPVIVNCPLNSQLVTETWTFAASEHFEIKMSLPQRGNDTNRMIPFGTLDPPSTTNGYWGVKQDTSGTWLYTWKVRFEDTKGSLTAKEWTFDYTSSSVYAPVMQVSGSVPTITAGGQVPCGSTMSGIPFFCGQLITVSMPEATVTEPWDYYNNYILPDIAAGNAAFPTGYAPTPKAKFYTKDETDELLEGKQDALTFDDVPTSLSNNPVKSDGIYRKLRQKEDAILTIFDSGTMTNDTVIADTGVGIDIPADGSYYQVTGCITWKGSPPTEAQLRVKFGVRSSDYLMARATNANDDNKNFMYLPVGCTFKADPYYPDDADTTIHVSVWGKTAAATGECDVCLVARRISNGFTT